MNHIFRVVWNINNACWQAVSEVTKGKSKSTSADKRGILKQIGLVCSLSIGALLSVQAMAAPTGGVVTHGAATISASGTTTTINQSTAKAVIDWTTFSTVSKETINFVQPSTSSIVLNRVIGTSSSTLYGALNANGQVFIVNPRGFLIGGPSRINVGGFVASTLNLTNDNFMNGNFNFSGQQFNTPLSHNGQITVPNGGTVAFISPRIAHGGTIVAPEGNVLFAAGTNVTLNLNNGSLVSYSIDAGRAGAIIDATGSIQADGGKVILTAQGVNALSNAVVNSSGVIQARTVNNKQGVIELSSDMLSGKVNITGGTLDASAPTSGDGGAITTSAKSLNIANGVTITTQSASTSTLPPAGSGWEATAHTINVQTPDGISASSLSTALNNGNVILNAVGAADGNININGAVNSSGNTVLTLNASKDININQNIALTGSQAKLSMAYGNGYDYKLADGIKVDITGSQAGLSINGTEYTVVNSLGVAGDTNSDTLQGMQNNLTGNYALGSDIDASATVNWNSGQGFSPIGQTNIDINGVILSGTAYSGDFHGLGHTVDSLTIQQPYMGSYFGYNDAITTPVGLFSTVLDGDFRDVFVNNASIVGGFSVGGLVGFQQSGILKNVHTSGNIDGKHAVGGVIGRMGDINLPVGTDTHSMIIDSSSSVSIRGLIGVGGLVGITTQPIYDSYATGNISLSDLIVPELAGSGAPSGSFGAFAVGGLVGSGAGIYNSYATGDIIRGGVFNGNYYNQLGFGMVGGLAGTINVGDSNYYIDQSYATGNMDVYGVAGGLVGLISANSIDQLVIDNSYATGNLIAEGGAGGLVGLNSGGNIINRSYATGNILVGTEGFAGGLVAKNYGTISNSYATGAVTSGDMVGGLVGENYSGFGGGQITNSYSSGLVTGTSNIGGLIGKADAGSTIVDSYWNTDTSGQTTSAGGVGKTTAQLQQISTFNGWDIADVSNPTSTSIWVIDGGNAMPTLRDNP